MKYAYISTQEPFADGVRIVQVQDNKDGLVDVEDLLFWVECEDNVNAVDFYYNTASKTVQPVTLPE